MSVKYGRQKIPKGHRLRTALDFGAVQASCYRSFFCRNKVAALDALCSHVGAMALQDTVPDDARSTQSLPRAASVLPDAQSTTLRPPDILISPWKTDEDGRGDELPEEIHSPQSSGSTEADQSSTVEDLSPSFGVQAFQKSAAISQEDIPCLRRPSVYPSDTSSCGSQWALHTYTPTQIGSYPPVAGLHLLPPKVQKYYQQRRKSSIATAVNEGTKVRPAASRRQLTAEEQRESSERLHGLQQQEEAAKRAIQHLRDLEGQTSQHCITKYEADLLVNRLYTEDVLHRKEERRQLNKKHRPVVLSNKGVATAMMSNFLARTAEDTQQRAARRAKLLDKYLTDEPKPTLKPVKSFKDMRPKPRTYSPTPTFVELPTREDSMLFNSASMAYLSFRTGSLQGLDPGSLLLDTDTAQQSLEEPPDHKEPSGRNSLEQYSHFRQSEDPSEQGGYSESFEPFVQSEQVTLEEECQPQAVDRSMPGEMPDPP